MDSAGHRAISMNPISFYRSITRRICRLPLDVKSIETLQLTVKQSFRSAKSVSSYSIVHRKQYDRLSTIVDDILERNKYRELDTLLDFIYKDKGDLEPWKARFANIRYNRWKSIWPQIHLLREFGKPKHISAYDKELSRMDGVGEFSILKELNLAVPPDLAPLEPLKKHSSGSDLNALFAQVQDFHKFLKKNSKALMTVTLKPLEVTYEPSRIGLPLSVAAREKKLRSKITYIKSLCQEFRPLKDGSLQHLILVATDEPGPQNVINPNFHRHAKRVRERVEKASPLERKYLLQKQLIPNDRNIRFLYRGYVTKKFTIRDGRYTMNPMQNFYD